MNAKDLFEPYKDVMLEYAQTDRGRKDMGILDNLKVVKVNYNSFVQDTGKRINGLPILRMIVRTYPVNLKIVDKIMGFRPFKFSKYMYLSGDPVYSASGDGQIYRGPEVDSWANVRGQATGSVAVSGDATTYMVIANRNDTTRALGRSYYPFDTSVLGMGANILTGNKFHWQFQGWGADVGTRPTLTLVASTVISTSTLALEDFDLVGATEFTATRFDTAAKVADVDYTITLDADGDAAISKTGFTKFAIRTNYDFDNSDPTSVTQQEILSYYSENTGVTKDPYLEIFYASGSSGLLSKYW